MQQIVLGSASHIVLRGMTLGFGLFALIWGAYTLPVFVSTSRADAMAFRITAGATYKIEALRAAETNQDNHERPRTLRSLAVIRLRLTELALANADQPGSPPPDWNRLETSVSKALEAEPSDAYLWVALFWLRVKQNGITEAALAPLRMSYLCGPHEGWIAVPRNQLVMSLFSVLPKPLQDAALTEFKLLVASGYAKQTAAIFIGPGWPQHAQLLAQVETVPDNAKRQFAGALHALNDEIIVPGVSYDHQH